MWDDKIYSHSFKKRNDSLLNYEIWQDFPSGPVAENLPSDAQDVGSIPSWGTKILHATGQLSLCASTKTREAKWEK